MFAQAVRLGWVYEVIPGTGAHLNDPRAEVFVDLHTAKTGPAQVEQSHNIAVFQAPRRGIICLHMHGFPAVDFGRLAVAAVIDL